MYTAGSWWIMEETEGFAKIDLVIRAKDVSWLIGLTQNFLCFSSWMIREKTLLMEGKWAINKI